MKFDFTSLRLFVAVCDERSIARASEREFIAASAVSKRIAELEGLVGTRLLIRHQKGVDPTPAGEVLLFHSRQVLRSLEKMKGELSEYSVGINEHIRILSNLSAIVEYLPEDLSSFLSRHNKVRIDLEENFSTRVVRGIEDGIAEIGIFCAAAVTTDLQILPYRTDRLILAVRHDHPLAGRQEVSFDESLGDDYIGMHSNSSLSQLMQAAANKAARPIKFRFQVKSFDAVCRMVEANLGIGLIPRKLAQSRTFTTPVSCIPLTDPWTTRQLKLCIRDYNSLSVAARMLVDHLTRAEAGHAAEP